MSILTNHFRSRTFDDLQATEMLRDDYLDKYFKDSYIEWGTRWYLEKLQTRTATNAKLLIKKLAKDGLLSKDDKLPGGSLIERIVSEKI